MSEHSALFLIRPLKRNLMASFGRRSTEQINTCDQRLIWVFASVVERYDCSVLEGRRSFSRQLELFNEGKSKLKIGKHCAEGDELSDAIDVAPYPIDMEDVSFKTIARFYHFAGYVLAIARELKVDVRWGGDWDSDLNFADQTFDDLVHWELVDYPSSDV